MANIEGLIPFLIYFETGVKDENADCPTLFARAKAKGIVNDPADRGGATLVGVTIGTYREYRKKYGNADGLQLKLQVPCQDSTTVDVADLRNLDYSQWLEILKRMFWDPWHADEINSQAVAEMLVDWVWTSGKYGITLPQKLLGVKPDGIVGPKTLAAVNAREPLSLFADLKKARIDYIESICLKRPSNLKFRSGWLHRINSIPG